LNTNRTNTFEITLTNNDINNIINLCLIFHNQASKLKFNQLKQLNIKKGHNICNNSHENLNFSQKNNTEISCQNIRNNHHIIIHSITKHTYIIDSIFLNLFISFLVVSSVVTGNANHNKGPTTVVNIINNESILVKYHDDSAHNLFTTNCWSTFHNNDQTFAVKNTQKAYLNCSATSFLSI
jgi:hypothetical protein